LNRVIVRSRNRWLVVSTSLILCLTLLVALLGPLAAGAQADERSNKTDRTETPALYGAVDWPDLLPMAVPVNG